MMIERWRSYLNAFPLPPHLTPVSGIPLSDVDDDSLLSCPPQLIAHVQRTASQGGYQVISPRQTPFSAMMTRRSGEDRMLGDYEVGSISNSSDEWPTLDGASLDFLLPDEPIAPITEEITVRSKTKTVAIAKGHELMSDPVLSCLVKGRAVIDILKRDDVAGGSEEMAQLLAEAWGIDVEDIMELDAYMLGLQGDLQRHAMRTDDVYPTIYAPTHVKTVISAGVADLDKAVLHPFVAMDWRRMRVFCECVFYNSCVVEGLPIKYMKAESLPGTRGTRTSRRNMLVFGPAPATAWSYAPETFCVMPTPSYGPGRKPGIPPEVRNALQMYIENVRPVSFMLARHKMVETWRSAAVEVTPAHGETLANSYARISKTMATGMHRGRTASSAVRNAIFMVLESAPLNVRTRLARYLEVASEECRIHLGLRTVPDSMIHTLAQKFSQLGVLMREKLVKEAEMRGSSIDLWWADILCQAPIHYSELKEGSFGWCKVGIWLLFREPTERWRKLNHAVKMTALADAAVASVGGISLPAKLGGIDRLVVASRHAIREISRSFAGYYYGMVDVGFAMAMEARDMGKYNVAGYLNEAAAMWNMRARSLSALNASPIAHDEEIKSVNHIRVTANPTDLVLKPAPYMAFKSWSTHVKSSTYLTPAVKKMVRDAECPDGEDSDVSRRSSVFSRMSGKICNVRESRLTRYLVDPTRMGHDLERAWKELAGDVRKVVALHATEAETATRPKEDPGPDYDFEPSEVIDTSLEPEPKKMKIGILGPKGNLVQNFWEVFDLEGDDIAEGLMEQINRFPEDIQAVFYEGDFEDPCHILETIDAYNSEAKRGAASTSETVM